MKIKKLGVALIGAAVLLSGCSNSVPVQGEESTQEACPEGHWQDDWEWKKKPGSKKKKLVNDRDWICDSPPVTTMPVTGPVQLYTDHWGDEINV